MSDKIIDVSSEFISIDELETEDVTSQFHDAETAGKSANTLSVLLKEISQLKAIHQNIVRHRDNKTLEYIEEYYYTKEDEGETLSTLTKKEFVNAIGQQEAQHIYNLLLKSKYVKKTGNSIAVEHKLLSETEENFFLTGDKITDLMTYAKLSPFFIKTVSAPKDNEEPSPIWKAFFSKEWKKKGRLLNSKTHQYIFRFGNTLYGAIFYSEPSPELLMLIHLRISLIVQENIQNTFSIVTNYCSKFDTWLKKDKRSLFFDYIGNILEESWRHFDLLSASLQINTSGHEYLFAKGGLGITFSKTGQPYTTILPEGQDFSLSNRKSEYLLTEIPVTVNRETGDQFTMDFYMRSKSLHNTNPSANPILDKYIKLLALFVGMLIDVVVPVIQMEQTEKQLKRQTFFDRLRNNSLNHGENIYLIIYDSFTALKWFYQLESVSVYMANKEIAKMLNIYKKDVEKKSNKQLLIESRPFTKEEIQKKNILPLWIDKTISEGIVFYLRFPSEGNEGYLRSTDFYKIVEEVILSLKEKVEIETVFDFLSTSLSYNAITTSNEFHNMVMDSNKTSYSNLSSLVQRLQKSFRGFFDLTVSIYANLETGINRMRASRDRLTGLYNRQCFSSFLDTFSVDKTGSYGLMFVDMDNFKIFNDSVSHNFGDKILIKLADRMINAGYDIPQKNLMGRFGGDEFCFALNGLEEKEFEKVCVKVFHALTNKGIPLTLQLEEKRDGDAFEINLISFLHRLIRPDVGGVRGGESFVEKSNLSPKEHILDIFSYYRPDEVLPKQDEEIVEPQKKKISNILTEIVEKKILNNRIFNSIDPELHAIIYRFIELQLDGENTNTIRSIITEELEKTVLERNIHIRLSCGVAHSNEFRVRSNSSLFKAADGRAYIAKHKGKNCVYGVNKQKLS